MKLTDQVIQYLYSLPGGRVADTSGRVNSVIKEKMGYEGASMNLSRALAALEQRALITRVIHGKRCPVVQLTEDGEAYGATLPLRGSPSPGVPGIAGAIGDDDVSDDDTSGDEVADDSGSDGGGALRGTIGGTVTATVLGTPGLAGSEPTARAPAAASDVGLDESLVARELLSQALAWLRDRQLKQSELDDAHRVLMEERAVSADLRSRLQDRVAEVQELQVDLRLLAADRDMYKLRAEQLERNMEAVLKGPDASIDRQRRASEMASMIGSRPHR